MQFRFPETLFALCYLPHRLIRRGETFTRLPGLAIGWGAPADGSGLSLLTFVDTNLEVGTPGRTRTDPLLRRQFQRKRQSFEFSKQLWAFRFYSLC